MEYTHIIANERPKDDRDLILGAAQAPAAIPASFIPDYSSWFKRNYQAQTTFCGEHSGTHLKAILDFNASGLMARYTPRYGTIKLKDPKSPVCDGFSLTAGTDMRSIFKWLQQLGADTFEPLENNVLLDAIDYCNPAVITPPMDANAATSKISNYAFGATDFQSLCQLIYQNKAVLLLIKCDQGFWGSSLPTFTTPTYGHFICAYGFDANYLYVVDSADPSDEFAFKKIAKEYIKPEFIIEAGTAIDPVQALAIKSAIVTDAAAVVQDVAQDTQIPAPAQESILQEIEEVIETLI